MDYRLDYRQGHVEVFTRQGEFLFSADTEQEALKELRQAS